MLEDQLLVLKRDTFQPNLILGSQLKMILHVNPLMQHTLACSVSIALITASETTAMGSNISAFSRFSSAAVSDTAAPSAFRMLEVILEDAKLDNILTFPPSLAV